MTVNVNDEFNDCRTLLRLPKRIDVTAVYGIDCHMEQWAKCGRLFVKSSNV